MKKLLYFHLIALFFLFSGTVYGEADLKIGYVSMNKAINLSNEGKRSKKFLEAQADQSRKFLKTKEKELLRKEQELKNNIMLNQEAKVQKQMEISKLKQELRNDLAKAQKSFREDEARHTSKIFKDLVAVVDKIAKRDKFDLIIEYSVKQTILFSKYRMEDITDKVTEEYNKLQSLK
ncbi:MAG: OmpH family outer membrane protein [Proteobacteria bacterium]|nr:OmpH family outer membrane protein [Pseudomonadota bacterium]